MKKVVLGLTLMASVLGMRGQAWEWAKEGKSIIDFKVETDAEGSVYSCGTFKSKCEFNGIQMLSSDSMGGFLMKTNPQGAVIWYKIIEAENLSIGEIDIENNEIYLGGGFRKELTASNEKYISAGKEDTYILKWSKTGDLLHTAIDGGVQSESISNMDVSSHGILVAGQFSPGGKIGGTVLTSQSSTNVFLANYNLNFQSQWVKEIKATNQSKGYSRYLKKDPFGNIFFTAHVYGSYNIFGVDTVFWGYSGGLVMRLRPNGNLDKFITDLAGYAIYPRGMDVDQEGNVYAMQGISGNHSSEGMHLMKYDSSGVKVWDVYAGGGYSYSSLGYGPCMSSKIKIKGKQVFVAAGYAGNQKLPDGFQLSGQGTVVFNYDTEGHLHWLRNSVENGFGYYGKGSTGLAVDNSYNVYIAGTAEDRTFFGDAMVDSSSSYVSKINSLMQESAPEFTLDPASYAECTGKGFMVSGKMKNVTFIKWYLPKHLIQYGQQYFYRDKGYLSYDSSGSFPAYVIIQNSKKKDSLVFNDIIKIHDGPTPEIVASGDQLTCTALKELLVEYPYTWYQNSWYMSVYQKTITMPYMGDYYVKVLYKTGCTARSEIYHYDGNATGIPALGASDKLKLSPNPSPGRFDLDLGETSQAIICVRDGLGNCILRSRATGPHYTIDLARYAKGVYYVEVEAEEKKQVRKIVIE